MDRSALNPTSDNLATMPADGVRQMCAWERFCAFAREPERRTVGLIRYA